MFKTAAISAKYSLADLPGEKRLYLTEKLC